MSFPPGASWQQRLRPVGYTDLDGRPAFKLGMLERDGRWYLYCGHLWHRGWTIVDVTDPRGPRPLCLRELPAAPGWLDSRPET